VINLVKNEIFLMSYGYSSHLPAEPAPIFNLLVYQQKARELFTPKQLFELWNEICGLYDKKQVTESELEELKDQILPRISALSSGNLPPLTSPNFD
jgi:hypothetical protein